MKFSIDHDIEANAVSGWASTDLLGDLGKCEVHLERFLKDRISVPLSRNRPDILKSGLHPTGLCGFSFDLCESACRPGDLVRISIESAEEMVCHTILLGDHKKIREQFEKLEYVRDDFEVMRGAPLEIMNGCSDFIALKILLIRLRRAKRAKGWRGKFEGYPHEHADRDWVVFRSMVDFGRWALFDGLSTRYLWSVVDTFADYSESHERLAALSLSSILMHERFAQTRKVIMDMTPNLTPIVHKQATYWGGMATNRLLLDDALDVFLTRSIENLEAYPLVYAFFIEIIIRMMDAADSSVGVNIKGSAYFQEAAVYYRQRFAAEKFSLSRKVPKASRASIA